MTSRLSQIAIRIRSELHELENVLLRIKEGWGRAQRSGDGYYLDGVALNLHSLYSGLERLFELIAVNVDGIKPEGKLAPRIAQTDGARGAAGEARSNF